MLRDGEKKTTKKEKQNNVHKKINIIAVSISGLITLASQL